MFEKLLCRSPILRLVVLWFVLPLALNVLLLATGCTKKPAALRLPEGQFWSLQLIAGQRMAALRGSPTAQVFIFDLAGQRELGAFPGSCYAVSADGSSLLVAGSQSPTIRWMNVETGKDQANFTVAAAGVANVALSADGRFFAASHLNESIVEVWELATGKRLFQTPDSQDGTFDLVFTDDGKSLVGTAQLGGARVWSIPDGAARTPLTHHVSVGTPKALVDARLAGAIDRIAGLRPPHSDDEHISVSVGVQGGHVASSLSSNYGPWKPLELWVLGREGALPVEGPGPDCRPTGMEFTPDGTTLVVSYNNDSLWLIDAATGQKRNVLFSAECDKHSVSYGPKHHFSADGKSLLVERDQALAVFPLGK